MQGDPREIPQELDRWLVAATKGLAPDAGTAVRDEYLDHFLDAVNELQATGIPPAEAAQIAVDSLGNPKVIRRQLRRTHLTTADLFWMRQWKEGIPPTAGWLVVAFFFLTAFTAMLVYLGLNDGRNFAQAAHYVAALATIAYCFKLLKEQNTSIFGVYVFRDLANMLVVTALIYNNKTFDIRIALISLLWFALWLRGYAIWRKLSRSTPLQPLRKLGQRAGR